jgi:hypothetical protein
MIRLHRFASLLLMASAGIASAGERVTLIDTVPYADDAEVQRKVRNECVKLQGQLSDYTRQFARAAGTPIDLVDSIAPDQGGRVLQMEIVEAVSLGNPFIGHRKYTRINGWLFVDGEQVASFKASRNSMGGAFGGYKGSCSVLGRTVKALGKDVAAWLENPEDGAELGDY